MAQKQKGVADAVIKAPTLIGVGKATRIYRRSEKDSWPL